MNIYKFLLNEVFLPERIRAYLCYKSGITIDPNIKLKKHVFFEEPSKVKIGNKCLINHYVHFYTGRYNESTITIGNNVSIGFDTKIITNTHMIGNKNIRAGSPQNVSVEIENGVWIGANCTILPGVKISSGGGNSRWSSCYA